MSQWLEILRAPAENDLGPLCQYLQARGVVPYVFERAGEQCLCVPDNTDSALLQRLIDQWNRGDVDEQPPPMRDDAGGATIFSQWWCFPVTLLLTALSALNYLLVATPWGQSLGGLHWLALMTMQPITIDGDELRLLGNLPGLDQLWRYWTPAFLHFSLFHILFNGLMLLELGRRIETLQGAQRLLCLVMAGGLLSNLAQFHAAPDSLFGGMSGVIYALIGYCWLYQRLRPAVVFNTPPGLMVMAVVWLLLCFSGLVTLAGMGKIANAAHAGGLLAGLLLGWLLALLDRHLT